MKNTTLIILAVLIIAAGGAYFYTQKQKKDTVADVKTPTETAGQNVYLTFEDKGEDPQSFAPRTEVLLHIGANKTYTAGTYNGSCTHVDKGKFVSDNQIAGALCYWAGFGDEVAIFGQNGEYMVGHREIQEPTAEAGEVRTNFNILNIYKF